MGDLAEREADLKRRQFIRRLRYDLLRAGDPATLVYQLPLLALMERHRRVFRRLMDTSPAKERGCLD